MNCIVRALEITDYSNGYYDCLQELTHAPKPDNQGFTQFFNQLNIGPLNKQVLVAEHNDPMTKQTSIVGTGSIFFEPKSIRGGCLKAHIEDIVVRNDFRNNRVGSLLMDTLVNIAKAARCYKIVLSCNENNRKFYESQGFSSKEISMDMYLHLDEGSKLNGVSDMVGPTSMEVLESESGGITDTSVAIQEMDQIVSFSSMDTGTSRGVLGQFEVVNEVSHNNSCQTAKQPVVNRGPGDVTESPQKNNLKKTVEGVSHNPITEEEKEGGRVMKGGKRFLTSHFV